MSKVDIKRNYALWIIEEDMQLVRELVCHLDINKIAKAHQRSIGAIRSRKRLIIYALRFVTQFTIEEINEINQKIT